MKILRGILAAVCVICFYAGYILVGYSPLLFGCLELVSILGIIVLLYIRCNEIYVNGVRIRRIK